MMSSVSSPESIAVFDLDRTLLMRTSGEIQLIRYLYRQKILPFSNFRIYLHWLFSRLPHSFSDAIITNKMYLAGLQVKEVVSHLPAFYDEHIFPRLSGCVQTWMEALRKRGYSIILLSATLDFILGIIADRMGVDQKIASVMEIKNGMFTGRILGEHPYHHGKVRSLLSHLEDREVDFTASYGFGDSLTDVPLLSLFGNPIAVNPGCLLKREAKRRKWMIIRD